MTGIEESPLKNSVPVLNVSEEQAEGKIPELMQTFCSIPIIEKMDTVKFACRGLYKCRVKQIKKQRFRQASLQKNRRITPTIL